MTIFLIWLGIVCYLTAGIFVELLVYNKSFLKVANEGKLYIIGWLKIGQSFSNERDPSWFTDWVALMGMIFTTVLWPAVILVILIVIGIFKLKDHKQKR